MQFTKIKHNGKKVELVWKTKTDHDEVEHHIVSDEPPDADLVTTMRKLGLVAVDLLGLPDPWGADLQVTTVTLSLEDDGALGCVLSGSVPLRSAKAPLNFNLPYLREHPDGELLPGYFPEGLLGLLMNLQEAAGRFVAGHRAQQALALDV